MKQLPLPIQLDQRATFENYICGPNQVVRDMLISLLEPTAEPQVFVWSAAGQGKTHLLQALCHLATARGMTAIFLPLKTAVDYGVQVLEGLDQVGVVCLDDFQAVCHDPDWAEGLFHFINRSRAAGARLVLTADRSPSALEIPLADLTSRLTWGPIFQLKKLADNDLFDFIAERVAARGLTVSDDVPRYLVKHFQRDPSAMIDLIDRLDEEALAQQRRITIPLIRSILLSSDSGDRRD